MILKANYGGPSLPPAELLSLNLGEIFTFALYWWLKRYFRSNEDVAISHSIPDAPIELRADGKKRKLIGNHFLELSLWTWIPAALTVDPPWEGRSLDVKWICLHQGASCWMELDEVQNISNIFSIRSHI